MTGSGRLADDGVPHARRPAVLRRHLLPARRSCTGMPGFAELCRRRRRRVADERRDELLEQAGQADRAPRPHAQLPRRRRGCPAPRRARPTRPTQLAGRSTTPSGAASVGAPKFPQTMSLDAAAAPRTARTGSAASARRRGDHRSTPWPPAASTTTSAAASPATRSTTGGWCPTSRRCSTTRRCSPASYLHAWQVTGEPALPPGGRARRSATCCATCATPDGGVLLGRGRRQRGRGGPFYVWTPAEISEVARRRRRPPRPPSAGGASPRRQLRGPHHPQPPARRRGDLRRPEHIEAARRRAVRRPRRRGSGPASTTRCSPSGTRCSSPRLAEAGAATGDRPDWIDAAVDDARASCWRTCAATTDAGCARGRPTTAAPATSPSPPTTPRSSTPSPASAEATGEARWIDEARADGRRPARPVLGRRRRRVLHHRPRRASASSPARRTCWTTPRRRPTAWPRSALLRLAALTGDAALPDHRRRSDPGPRSARCAGQYPTAFGHLLAAVDLDAAGITEVVVAGDGPDLVAAVRAALPAPTPSLAWGEPYASPLWEGREPTAGPTSAATSPASCPGPTPTPARRAAHLRLTPAAPPCRVSGTDMCASAHIRPKKIDGGGTRRCTRPWRPRS